MINTRRRHWLRLGAALFTSLAGLPAFSRSTPVAQKPVPVVTEKMISKAMQLIRRLHAEGQDIIEQPVGMLQRHLRLGYGLACQLRMELENRGVWTIYYGTHRVPIAKVDMIPFHTSNSFE